MALPEWIRRSPVSREHRCLWDSEALGPPARQAWSVDCDAPKRGSSDGRVCRSDELRSDDGDASGRRCDEEAPRRVACGYPNRTSLAERYGGESKGVGRA